ncbi:hypothetical protein IHE56_02860 [Streptomyces sp. ID01-12c]|uniref:Uncharacterized protein n=1 Tax=Streptomyces caniscabiei TaxID=2746961 RepID=A0A927L2F6_9ACTN|nr:hypothetical protein [Streptomyces caniscabiei]MBD9701048.1 hypothetical protein [Streptomyces caniscabiei]MBD9724805.1 hypothetical protein [Streptomyces caniscabiei]MDX3510624.1 hypothetical protein [Streptomyces caniscabiei]MDX3720707.1 hypothetical protein [Streptomyces caniscabiei]MDX3732563.1 hypothetical protein [Streptomyces caniscabiei]
MHTQIAQISHTVASAGDPAGLGLALAVAAELHPPVTRAPEVASAARGTARRTAKARAHRRTVRG